MCLMLPVSPGEGQIFRIIRNKNPGLKEDARVSHFSRIGRPTAADRAGYFQGYPQLRATAAPRKLT